MKLTPVPKRSGLDRLSFKKEFLEPMQPVVFTDLIDTWPAKEKWTFDFFIGKAQHISNPGDYISWENEIWRILKKNIGGSD